MNNAKEIFHRYEEIRPRLPQVNTSGPSQKITSLLDLTDQVEAFVFDAFGVLNVGDSLIPGADIRLRELRRAGCLIRVLTNAASYDKSGAIAKFQNLGIALDPSEIITSRDAALSALDARHWGVIAAPEDGLADVPHKLTRLGDLPAEYDAVEGILFLSTATWTGTQQSLLESSLAHSPRPVIIANADLVAPRGQVFSLEPGFYGHEIADHTKADVRFFGKPFPEVFTLVKDTLPGIQPDKIAICGDSLHTDILGGAAADWKTVLVTRDGLFARTDVEEFVRASEIFATWQLERI